GSKYVSSFVGFAPADNPSVVVAVVLDEPQGGARDGGQVSAPIFREIAESVLPELNVVPDGTIAERDAADENIPEEAEIRPPSTNASTNKAAEKTDKKTDGKGAGKTEKNDKTPIEKIDKAKETKKMTGEKEKLKSPKNPVETQKKEKSKTIAKNRDSISSHRFLKYKLIYENISAARRSGDGGGVIEAFFERIEAKT
ncbi:MAG TPA: penicillin-binding transpeptidase domain-containing protein, partial [Pyrinomonadaceae bacterium]|nr:penicillin-binding transpeptidase domain-containing protein [Pyrinomonadaceae bacterium]